MTAPYPPCMAPDGAEPCAQYRNIVAALAASEARERTLLSRCGDARRLLKEARFWIDRTRGAHEVAGRIDAFLAGSLPDAPAPEKA